MPLSRIFKSLPEWDAQLLLGRHEWSWAESTSRCLQVVVWCGRCRQCQRQAQAVPMAGKCEGAWTWARKSLENGQRTRKTLGWEEFSDRWEKDGLEGFRAALRLKRQGTGVLRQLRESWEATTLFNHWKRPCQQEYFMLILNGHAANSLDTFGLAQT